MLMPRNPADAYRRVDFDARVAGANPAALVHICYDQLGLALDSALAAADRGDNGTKSQALARALSALVALGLGVTPGDETARSLTQFYAAARRAVLDSVLAFDGRTLRRLRGDVADIAAALRAA